MLKMETINVLILSGLGETRLNQIRAISPRLKVIDGSTLLDIKSSSDPGKSDPESQKKLDSLLAEAEVICGFRSPPDLIRRAPRLKWFQLVSAGAEQVLSADMVNSQVVLTNTRGIHGVQISELVYEMMLMHVKHAHQCFLNQQNKQWSKHTPGLLSGKTLGIVGYGAIGKELARLGKAFGMRVVGTRRSVLRSDRARYVDKLYPREQMGDMLAESDFVALALPATPETFKMFGKKELGRMKPTAFLVNIGRGSTVDEEALVRALQEKRIGGAGLDCFYKEPLPQESPLWDMPNVIISPHIGGTREDYQSLSADIICRNLERYIKGQRLMNIVNKKKGY
jgi:D-2-hydroxyacid dehydrogenase (NADP+)